jgi:hypothetical protein
LITFGHNCFWGWGATVWGCFSFDCKLDLYVLDGNLTGQNYRDNVLAPRVGPHFDNHALADRPIFMDDNARPHRAQIVQHFLQQEVVQTIPWPAMSPDMKEKRKTSLSLMEVFNIALKCRVFRF